MTARQGGDRERMPELCSLPAPRKSRGHRSPWLQADLPPTLNQPRCRTTRDHPTARSPPKSLKLSGPALARLACPAAHPSHGAAAEAAAGTVPHRLCLADRPRRFPTRPRAARCAPPPPLSDGCLRVCQLTSPNKSWCSPEHSPDSQLPRVGARGRCAAESTHRCPSTGHV